MTKDWLPIVSVISCFHLDCFGLHLSGLKVCSWKPFALFCALGCGRTTTFICIFKPFLNSQWACWYCWALMVVVNNNNLLPYRFTVANTWWEFVWCVCGRGRDSYSLIYLWNYMDYWFINSHRLLSVVYIKRPKHIPALCWVGIQESDLWKYILKHWK